MIQIPRIANIAIVPHSALPDLLIFSLQRQLFVALSVDADEASEEISLCRRR
jgi:hypothetical protein